MRRPIALLITSLCLPAAADAQSRTAWEMAAGGGVVRFPMPFPDHGDPMEFAFASIPTPGDPRWHSAPNPATIDFDIRSTLCDMGSSTCMQTGVFTYFRTELCLPDPRFAGTVRVRIGEVDDGARVTLFGPSHPGGVLPASAFAQILMPPDTTGDFRSLLDTGRNTIVISHVDDCCTRSALRSVDVLVDGVPLPPGLATEVCNGLDDDCNGRVDDGLGSRTCGVGACERMVPNCLDGSEPACVPGMPSREVCNDVDDDCNGVVDDGLGMTSCGVGACENVVPNCAHGMPVACVPGAPRTEICNGIDDDCDGVIDNGCVEVGPEPMPDVVTQVDSGIDGCHDWRCDPHLRIEGRAGPAGDCACGVDRGLRGSRGVGPLLVALVAVLSRESSARSSARRRVRSPARPAPMPARSRTPVARRRARP